MQCNCRSVEECTHKFADVSVAEVVEIVKTQMRESGQIPKSERPATPQGKEKA